MIMHDHVSTSLHTVSNTHFIWIANSTWAIYSDGMTLIFYFSKGHKWFIDM